MLPLDALTDGEVIRRLYAYVAFRIGDGPDAEDVVSDTIERALRYRRSYDAEKGEPIAWLVGIARGRIAKLRSRPTAISLQPADAAADAGTLETEIVERIALNSAVARLNPHGRELVALHYGADLTPRDIAQLLGATINSVEVALHRTRARLHALLEHEEGWEDERAKSGASL